MKRPPTSFLIQEYRQDFHTVLNKAARNKETKESTILQLLFLQKNEKRFLLKNSGLFLAEFHNCIFWDYIRESPFKNPFDQKN